jgi:hypothetical protein
MKYILEYEEADVRSLMGSLDSVGQMKTFRGTLWARFNTYRLMSDYWSSSPVILCFLRTETIFATGDETKDKALMLKSIQNGDFSRPNDPDARSWTSLRNGNKVAIDLLEKRRVQSLAKSCSTMEEFLEELREGLVGAQMYALQGQLSKTRYTYSEEAASTVLVYGFFAPEGSPYLVTSSIEKPIMKGDDINYFSE